MKKSKERNNTLIKRKSLVKLLRKEGIKRISPKALDKIEKLILEYLISLSAALKENIVSKGKKTLQAKDISEVIKNGDSEQYWEI